MSDIYPISGVDRDYLRNIEGRTADRIQERLTRYAQAIKLTGGTSTVPNWMIKQILLREGAGAFAPKDGKLYFLTGSRGGRMRPDYLPGEFIFDNPYIPWSAHLRVGEECVYAKNDTYAQGILPIIKRSSYLLTHTELSVLIALITSRAMMQGIAGRDSEAQAIDNVIKDLERGELKSIIDSNILNPIKLQNLGETDRNLFTELIEITQYIKASEANDLGLAANWNAKRETLTSSETLLNDDTLHPFIDDMMECWKEWTDEVNNKYGDLLDNGPFVVDWASAWKTNAEQEKAEIKAKKAAAAVAEDKADEMKEEGEDDEDGTTD